MKRLKNLWGRFAIAFVATTLLGACSPIADIEEGLEVTEKRLASGYYRQHWETVEDRILKKSDDNSYQTLAENFISEQKKTVDKEIGKLSSLAKKLRSMEDESNSDETALRVKRLAHQMNMQIRELKALYRDSDKEMTFLESLVAKRDKQYKKLEKAHSDYVAAVENVLPRMSKAKTDYPAKAERIVGFESTLADFKQEYDWLKDFLSVSVSNRTLEEVRDFYQRYNALNVDENFPLTLAQDYNDMIDQLYTSYTKILLGAKGWHSVKMEGVSWNNYYDFPTEHKMEYPYVDVDRDTYERVLRAFSPGRQMREYEVKTDALLTKATDRLNKANFTSGDDEAEIWVQDYEAEYEHRYLLVSNNETAEVVETVDQKTHDKLKNHIGKEVISKPFGHFEDEVIDIPSEPGMSLVGNEQYGRWVDNGNGGQMWQWLAGYMILSNMFDVDYDRRSYNRYRDRYASYTPPYKRKHNFTNQYGVPSSNARLNPVAGRAGMNGLRGAGVSARNKGPGRGK